MKNTFKKIASLLLCLCLIISGMIITASAADTTITFEFGANGTASHKDGSDMGASKSYTEGDYTLAITGASKVYSGAYDATGKSALKLGTGSVVATFSITVPDDVTSVIFMVAKYKANATTVSVNGTNHTISTASDNGEYTPITVDTTTTKTITFATTSSGKRCMIDSIAYVIADSTGGEGGEGGEGGGETPDPEEPGTDDSGDSGEDGGDTPTVTADSYVKVTEAPADWSGTYLIVYEGDSSHNAVAFKGSLSTFDSVENGVAVTLNNGTIAATEELNASTFTIAQSGTGYSIKGASNKFISQTSYANGLTTSDEATAHTITLDADSNVNLSIATSGGTVTLKYNYASNQLRFRYYKSGQQAIALYKFVEAKAPVADMGNTSVDVKEDLAVNQEVTVKPEDIEGKELLMHFTMNGATTTVPCDPSQIVDNTFTFTFDNIGVQCMADPITATLVTVENDSEDVQATSEFSVKSYAKKVLETSTDAATKKFVSDMLRYGAAAQTYTNHTENGLATDGLDTLLVEGSSTEVPEGCKMALTKSTSTDIYFKGATVRFDNVNSLVIRLSSKTANTKVLVNDVEATLVGNDCIISDLKATD
ncbi:MAG: hypothetical protein IJN15_04930, partial [Clostridia bacterium]|nr:hypothetical protein [Clostridia bacterium]